MTGAEFVAWLAEQISTDGALDDGDRGVKLGIVELHTGPHECVVLAGPNEVLPTRTTYVADGYIHALDPTLLLLAEPYGVAEWLGSADEEAGG